MPSPTFGYSSIADPGEQMQNLHTADTAATIPADLAAGHDNERSVHAPRETDNPTTADDQGAVRQGLSSVFEHVDSLLKDLERSKTTLGQRSAALSAEREAHHEIKMRLRLLNVEHERVNGELSALQTELERQSALATDLETTIGSLQHSLGEKSKMVAENTRRFESDREKHHQLMDEIQRVQSELNTAEDRVFELETGLSAAKDAVANAGSDIRKRDLEILELRQQALRTSGLQEELRANLADARQHHENLGSELENERNDHARVRGLLQAESDGRRGDQASLQLKNDSLAARADLLDRSHAMSNAQLAERVDEVRLLEKLLREQQTNVYQTRDSLHRAELELDDLRNRAEELESSRSALQDHAEGLAMSLRTREREGNNWKQKIDSANERLRIETQRFEADRDNLSQSIARLTAQLEQEKIARSMAEGALDVSRKERLAQSRNQTPVRLVASQAEVLVVTGTHGKS